LSAQQNSGITVYKNQLFLFILAMCFWGFATATGDAIFNNYLNDSFRMSDLKRSLLEIPRELPGLSVAFISALFFFLCSRRLAAVAMLMGATGTLFFALTKPTYSVMLVWLFIFSMGQHLMLPLSSAIGMELAKENEAGKRLGQLNSAKNFAAIAGSTVVFLGFRYLHFKFSTAFLIATGGYICASVLLFRMRPVQKTDAKAKLMIYKEYKQYYWLTILYGARKQIFLTFAPWVLVTVFNQPTAIIATLLTIGGVIGIFFQPLLGMAIDKFGEKSILAAEALILIVVCFGYGFAKEFLGPRSAFIVTAACFMIDQMLMSVSMARATWLKKIVWDPSHITPTLQMAVSLDHVFSIFAAVLGGLIWKRFGYEYVFLFAAGIAVVNLFSALRISTFKVTQPAVS